MNLCDRLQRCTPCGYGTRYTYSIRGIEHFGKAGLIRDVVERYSCIYKIRVTQNQATEMYERLTDKYCEARGAGPTLRSLAFSYTDSNTFAHPKNAENYFSIQLAQARWEDAANHHIGPYAPIKSCAGECSICGGPLRYALVSDLMPELVVCFRGLRDLSSVCRNPMCKALAKRFRKHFKAKLPMAAILMELTKNGDRTAAMSEIKAIALQNIQRAHASASRQKIRQGDRLSSAGI